MTEYAIMREPGRAARRHSSSRPRRMAVVEATDGVQALSRYAAENMGDRWEVVETRPATRTRAALMDARYRNGAAVTDVTFYAWRTT